MMKQTKYLIIGGGTAAIGGVQGIRETDPDGSITMVSEEHYPTYSRPLISYWLEGRVDDAHMHYRPADFYEKNNVDLILDTQVTALDATAKIATLSNGEALRYQKALIATGSVPFVPPIKGKDKAKNAFTFTTFDDAKGVEKVLEKLPEKSAKVVILGAGLIGLKAAEALVDQVAHITVLDLADRVLPSILDDDCAGMMKDYLEDDLGMSVKLKTSIADIKDGEVILTDDTKEPYDILILAVGTRPNQALAEKTGANCGRGIIINAKQATSLKDIYAAGDCTQSHDVTSKTDKNIAILPNAFMQGETAGINMAGGDAVYDRAFPVNAMAIKDFKMLTAGSYVGDEIVEDEADGIRKFYVEDDELKGFMILGDCDRAGIYTDLIRTGRKLSSLDWPTLEKAPRLAAYAKADRREKLALPH